MSRHCRSAEDEESRLHMAQAKFKQHQGHGQKLPTSGVGRSDLACLEQHSPMNCSIPS
jgi:hypothetical protein